MTRPAGCRYRARRCAGDHRRRRLGRANRSISRGGGGPGTGATIVLGVCRAGKTRPRTGCRRVHACARMPATPPPPGGRAPACAPAFLRSRPLGAEEHAAAGRATICTSRARPAAPPPADRRPAHASVAVSWAVGTARVEQREVATGRAPRVGCPTACRLVDVRGRGEGSMAHARRRRPAAAGRRR